jgi:hypothetical protein
MRSIALYIVLVGTPVLGILGVLHVGQSLTPPIALHGVWNITLDPQYTTDPACITPLDVAEQRVLTVVQSGSHLVLTFNDANATTLSGIIEGQTIIAHTAGTIILHANANQKKVPDQLQGNFTFLACRSRMAVHFIAIPQHAASTKVEGH